MPMDSSQIAALTGGFNQQVMMGMQHSAMVSQMYGGYMPGPMTQPVPSQGQQFAGAAMGAMGNVGMSAMGSQRLSNFGGGIAQPFANAGQYVMGQAMYGAQQQQMLDANLRQSFRYQNEFGGRGFTQAQTSGIGADLRSLAMQRGPGGETTNFEELGRLASNMGRMGMAEGVRGVKDFNEKFKQMLTSVKTIATELSTSLEEAQKVMASMQGAGIFKNQGQVAGLIRRGAVAGNLSTSEISGMAMIGSQISRSVGGLGRQGAMAGISAITQVGAAQQAGVISEEDIYNSTGLTGAEGRRAFAQAGLAREANFYRKSGRSRWMLASIAGKNGELDEESVQQLMYGEGGVEGTRSRAQSNLSSVGRPNFLRNEGRLRGAALERFGLLGSTLQYKDWLKGKGYDPNNMDDTSMLAFQRFTGMGRDEADQAVRMVNALPLTLAQQKRSVDTDNYARILEKSQRRQSPQEVLKELSVARAGVNDKFRQAGSDIQDRLATTIGEFMAKSSGDYFDRTRADLSGDIGTAYRGGTEARSVLSDTFGLESGAFRADTGTTPLTKREFGTKGMRDKNSELFGGGMSGAQFNRFLGSQAGVLQESGYNVKDIKNQGDYARVVLDMDDRQRGYIEGGSKFFTSQGPLPGAVLDAATSQELRGTLAGGGLQGKEKDFLTNVERALQQLSTTQGKELAKAFSTATDKEKARMVKDVLSVVGMDSLGAGKFGGSGQLATPGIFGGKFASPDGLNAYLGGEAYAGYAPSSGKRYGKQAAEWGERLPLSLSLSSESRAGRFISALTKPVEWTGKAMDWMGDKWRGMMGATDAEKKGVGEFWQSKEGRSTMKGYFSSNAAVRNDAREATEKRRAELSSKENRSSAEQAELAGLQGIAAAAFLIENKSANSDQLSAASKRIYGEGGTIERLVRGGTAAGATYNRQLDDARDQFLKDTRRRGAEDVTEATRRAPDVERLLKEGKISSSAADYMKSMVAERTKRSTASSIGDLSDVQNMSEQRQRSYDSLGMKDRESIASGTTAVGGDLYAPEGEKLRHELSVEKRLMKAGKRGSDSDARAVAGMLGADFAKGDLKGTAAEQAGKISSKMGLDLLGADGADARKELERILGDKGMSVQERARAISSFQGREEVATANTKKQNSQAEQNDPSYRVLTDIKGSLAKMETTSAFTASSLETLPVDLAKAMKNPESGT